jgi:N6-L-threonylcarbamoyladenine synthase
MGLVLGLESSCDETAVALVRDGRRVLGEAIASQADDFAAWGGVVPEIAARGHVAALPGLITQVLARAGVTLDEVTGIAVGAWPGLIGSLLTGVTAAKMIAARRGLPLVAVDHIQAHLAAIHLEREEVRYPLVGLVASGGHSHFYVGRAPGQFSVIGGTIDDAAGEAFDKTATVLGLPYPGGPIIDKRAQLGNPRALNLPRSFMHDDTLRLSFAGMKTALLYHARGAQGKEPLRLDDAGINDACASFQSAVVDCLVAKLILAARQQNVSVIALGGGVACNSGLRARLQDVAARENMTLYMPAAQHCADNAAMIAALGHYLIERGELAPPDLAPLPTGTAGPRH